MRHLADLAGRFGSLMLFVDRAVLHRYFFTVLGMT